MYKIIILFLAAVFITSSANSQDGWYSLNPGNPDNDKHVSHVFFVDKNNGWAINQVGLILHTIDGGNNWITQDSNIYNLYLDIYFYNKKYGWVTGQGCYNYTTDGGESWNMEDSRIGPTLNKIHFIDSLNGWAVGNHSLIIHTTDGGENWNTQNSSTDNKILLGVYFIDSLKGWVVGVDGIILHTSDGGINWVQYDTIFKDHNITSVFFIDSLHGWAAGGNGLIIYTSDGGENWIRQNAGTNSNLSNIWIVDSSRGWASGQNGTIIHTSNGGKDWVTQYSEKDLYLVSLCFVDSLTGWAVGYGGIILHTTTGGITNIEEEYNFNNSNDNLSICYPNPFSTFTTIKYKVPAPGFVRLSIYNIYGRETAVLANGYRDAGKYSELFDAMGLPSGIYFCQMNAGGTVVTKKMIVNK